MIHCYVARGAAIQRVEIGPEGAIPPALWLDLDQPTEAERRSVEAALAIPLPTREEMQEIEPSSRLYSEGGALFMTATIIAHADDPNPTANPISFILAHRTLVTLRYSDPRPFLTYGQRLVRAQATCASAEEALIGILETVIDRIADILEKVSTDLDAIARQIFAGVAEPAVGGERSDLQVVLKNLSRDEDLTSTARESLLGLLRVVRYFTAAGEAPSKKESKDQKTRLKTIARDIAILNEHVSFELQKIAFLLDATLGMINIEQNRIIKLFSVAAVVFLPPTLVASIYGMNFDVMPELKWVFGYPMAIAMMILSAVLPYLYFKRRGWL
ncbi:MAG: magnesium transporter CorA family protein [Alphaproteobacteria bacterium]|nr:magnesium transporter CorA family protein [Alphaproteobacteria bacterium]